MDKAIVKVRFVFGGPGIDSTSLLEKDLDFFLSFESLFELLFNDQAQKMISIFLMIRLLFND